jgi:hypothetical protein
MQVLAQHYGEIPADEERALLSEVTAHFEEMLCEKLHAEDKALQPIQMLCDKSETYEYQKGLLLTPEQSNAVRATSAELCQLFPTTSSIVVDHPYLHGAYQNAIEQALVDFDSWPALTIAIFAAEKPITAARHAGIEDVIGYVNGHGEDFASRLIAAGARLTAEHSVALLLRMHELGGYPKLPTNRVLRRMMQKPKSNS